MHLYLEMQMHSLQQILCLVFLVLEEKKLREVVVEQTSSILSLFRTNLLCAYYIWLNERVDHTRMLLGAK